MDEKEVERKFNKLERISGQMTGFAERATDLLEILVKKVDILETLVREKGANRPDIFEEVNDRTFIDVGGFSFSTRGGRELHEYVVTYCPTLKMVFVNKEKGDPIIYIGDCKYIEGRVIPLIRDLMECLCLRGKYTIFDDNSPEEYEYDLHNTMIDYLIVNVEYMLKLVLMYNHFNKEILINPEVTPKEYFEEKYRKLKGGDRNGNSGAPDSAGVPCS